MDLQTLLVWQVSALVSATADAAAQTSDSNALQIEADLYDLLALNCAAKAGMAKAFAAEKARMEKAPA
jgi:hypothetical protein